MSYNKARAKKKWLKWKNDEEQQLRELGVDEEIIQRLHMYDWEEFKSDRRFYEKLIDISEYIDVGFATDQQSEGITTENVFDNIENEKFFEILKKQMRLRCKLLS